MNGLEIFLLYLIIIIILLFTLTIHELGHFFAAKAFGVHVKEFSIGIGPKICWRITKKNQTMISLRLFPIMAYVLMDSKALKDAYKDDTKVKNWSWYMQDPPKCKILLEQAKNWQYLIIMLAGVGVNFLFFMVFWPITEAIFQMNNAQFINPFVQLGQSFEALWYNCIFDINHASGSLFGQIIAADESVNWGLTMLSYLLMINLLSVILNLIPLPPLDGYKVVANLYTKSTGKQVNEKLELALLIIAIILTVYILLSSIIVDILKGMQPQQELLGMLIYE